MFPIFCIGFGGIECLRGIPARHNAKLENNSAQQGAHRLSFSPHCSRIFVLNAQLSVPVPHMLGRRAVAIRMAYSWPVFFILITRY
jgi:hypothetical protein